MAFAGFVDNGDTRIPRIWIDDAATDLPVPAGDDSNGGMALSPVVHVDGMSYVGGFLYDGGYNEAPCYWTVSGGAAARTDLPLQDRAGGVAQAVAVSGGVVYAAGVTLDGSLDSFPCYWRIDGETITRIDLPVGETGSGAAFSIAVSGDDVSVAGFYDNGTTTLPCYWRHQAGGGDPVRVDLPAGTDAPEGIATSIALSGGTIYIGGNFRDGENSVPCFWTVADGATSRTDLTVGGESFYGLVQSLVVSGGAVYAGGYHSDGTGGFPCVWTRPAGGTATRTDLSLGEDGRGAVTSMIVSGESVVAGGFNYVPESEWTACRWTTGGERTDLEDGSARSAIDSGYLPTR